MYEGPNDPKKRWKAKMINLIKFEGLLASSAKKKKKREKTLAKK